MVKTKKNFATYTQILHLNYICEDDLKYYADNFYNCVKCSVLMYFYSYIEKLYVLLIFNRTL